MPTTTLPRPLLLRLVSTLVLALTATMLSAGSAHAVTPGAGRSFTADADPGRGTTTSVLLAHNQIVFRSGLRAVLESQPDLRCVGEVGDGPAVVREMRRLRPDIAILALDLPGLDDTAVAEPVAEFGSTSRILALASERTDENLYRALRLGASGFLTEALPGRDLVAAVRAAAHNPALIDPLLTRRLIERLSHGIEPFPTAPELTALTPREHEVLILMAKAATNPEIAVALGIGEQTVKTHVSNVLAKLGVRDRVHAVVWAHTRRIVPVHHYPSSR
ncbi:LuxR C-terminal-related transcriptional regulator [Nocardia sp. NPDC003482]